MATWSSAFSILRQLCGRPLLGRLLFGRLSPGASFHLEMELYQRAGIPASAIIRMATRNGAEALGLEAELGTVEVGKRADLVVLGSNPLDDIRNTRDIDMVIVDGRLVVNE